MKKLDSSVKNTVSTVKPQTAIQETSSGGLSTEVGRGTLPSPKVLDSLEAGQDLTISQAILVKSLVRRTERGNHYFQMGKQGLEKVALPELTEREQKIAQYYSKPATKETILKYIEKLAMRKRIDTNDMEKAAYLIADDTNRLFALEVSEMDMAIMVEHFTNSDTSAFYPQFSQMKERIKK